MTDIEQNIVCAECGHELPSEWISQAHAGQHCEECGSTNQKINLSVTEEVSLQINDWMDAKVKDDSFRSGKKIRKRVFAGDDLRVSKGDYVDKLRVIDKDNDLYIEKITDKETGEVIHHTEEPLSEHFGHGAAKVKKEL